MLEFNRITNGCAVLKSASILSKQRASFSALAAKAGLTSAELEQRLLYNFRSSYRESQKGSERMEQALGSPWGPDFKPSPSAAAKKDVLENTNDYWEYLAAFEELLHFTTRSYVTREAPSLPLNWPYLESIARRYSLPQPTLSQNSFGNFLNEIPATYLFNYEFNAFLDWTDNTCPPAIYYYMLLQHTITELSKIAGLKLMVTSNPEAFPRNIPIPDNSVFDSEVERLLSFVLDGRMFSEPFLPSVSVLDPKIFISVIGLEICALNFVAFHEYGHLLLGHPKRPQTPTLEFEADVFAMQLISKSGFPNLEHAIVTVLAILNVLEINNGSSNSHPPTLERLTHLANAEGIGLDFKRFGHAANFYHEIFDAVLNDRFGRGLFQS